MTTEEKKDFIRDMVAKDLAEGYCEVPITRFPPEPNGYLHIGHAKAICLDFGLAKEYAHLGAVCHLRFDDTNPCKEDIEFVNSIQEDIHWLGFDWGEHLYWASNIFDFYYDCAVALIKKGLAYVDLQDRETMRQQRGNLVTPGIESPYRNTSVEENLALFEAMKRGDYAEGAAVLRAKIDMASSNMNMRDPVIYRISYDHHHNTGNTWCIYPMYDFAHPLEDAYEHITHSLCTLEFENHRPLYEWVIDNCPVPARPKQREFSRLNITYTVMSKRKLRQMVEEGYVAGWDDPRMPTICGMRRRGYPAKAIVDFCEGVGITKFNGNTDVARLENAVRAELNTNAERRIPVQYAKRMVGRRTVGGTNTYIPIKVNMAGVIPVIFASSMLYLPSLIAQFNTPSTGTPPEWVVWINNYLTSGDHPFYMAVYFLLIVFFTFVIFGIELNDNFVAVMLTILGYSLNDTIVIFDRVRTTRRRSDAPLADVVNDSLHAVMRRTIITTVTTCLAIASVLVVALVMRVDSIISFALPMLLGSISGSYSSLFLSGPIWVRWMERKAKKAAKK